MPRRVPHNVVRWTEQFWRVEEDALVAVNRTCERKEVYLGTAKYVQKQPRPGQRKRGLWQIPERLQEESGASGVWGDIGSGGVVLGEGNPRTDFSGRPPSPGTEIVLDFRTGAIARRYPTRCRIEDERPNVRRPR